MYTVKFTTAYKKSYKLMKKGDWILPFWIMLLTHFVRVNNWNQNIMITN